MKKLDEYEVIANLEREASINQEKLRRWFPHFGVSLQRQTQIHNRNIPCRVAFQSWMKKKGEEERQRI